MTEVKMFNLQYLLPGEHVVSGFLRSFIQSGYFDFGSALTRLGVTRLHQFYAQDLFSVAQLNIVRMYQHQFGHSLGYLMREHTLYPLYNVGNPFPLNEQLIVCLLQGKKASKNLWVQRQDKAYDRDWKFCRKCIQEDQKFYGVSYWHCNHQVPTSAMCYVHNEELLSIKQLYKMKRKKVIPNLPHNTDVSMTNKTKVISKDWDQWLAQLYISLKNNKEFNLLKAKSFLTTYFNLDRIILLPEDSTAIHQTFDIALPMPKLHHYKIKQMLAKDAEKYLVIMEKYLGFQVISEFYTFYNPQGRLKTASFKNFVVEPIQNIKQQIEDPISYLLLLFAIKLSPEYLEIDYGQFTSNSAA